MSEECCGPDEPRKARTIQRVELTRSHRTGDACCEPDPVRNATSSEAHEEGDACCGPALPSKAGVDDDEIEVRPPWWRDIALLPSALSGLFLVAGYAFEWAGIEIPALVLQWAALLTGAYTFVPGAIRRLIRGRLGVGLLMTIAAIGAVLLGHVGEAATLAFLFSLAEALEDRAMDRAKEGLRALLSLIPETVRVSRLAGDTRSRPRMSVSSISSSLEQASVLPPMVLLSKGVRAWTHPRSPVSPSRSTCIPALRSRRAR